MKNLKLWLTVMTVIEGSDAVAMAASVSRRPDRFSALIVA
jgi:hypothetical protein